MQFRATVLLALFATGAFAVERASTRLQAQAQARVWLRQHPHAGNDELEEVKEANPEAYAIVKALLTKQSLGLLDPKHPSASFANARPAGADPQEPAPSGAAAFAKFATPDELKGKPDLPQKQDSDDSDDSSAAYAQAPIHHSQRDWLNWKPEDSANNDDAMVKNVLGAVADLKGAKSLRGTSLDSQSALSVDEAALGVDDVPVTTTVAAPQKPADSVEQVSMEESTKAFVAPVETPPVASMNQENSYLKGLDLGTVAPKPRARPLQDNAYLKGLGLSGEAPQAPQGNAASNDIGLSTVDTRGGLAGFSWDDDKPAQTTTQAPVARKHRAAKSDSLAGWLGLTSKKAHVDVKVAKPTAPPADDNPYTAALD